MRYALALLVACVLLVPIAAPAQGQGDEALIRKNIEQWGQQFNARDAAALAKWYPQNSVYVTPTGLKLTGPAEIQTYFEHSFQQSPKSRIAIQVARIWMVKPDLALGEGTFEITDLTAPDGKPIPMKGPWVTTFFMQGGQWAPLAHAAAMAMPMPPAPK